MKRKVIPMSSDEFMAMPTPFGWKAEYFGGEAHLTPREVGVSTRLQLSPRPQSSSHRSIPFDRAYIQEAIAGYYEAFVDGVEFCDWPIAEIRASGEKCIEQYFTGVRGRTLPASVLALEPDGDRLAGLALFILKHDRPYLDLLYVRADFRRQGMATAMVDRGVNYLLDLNYCELFSAYHICNEQSCRWHHQYGFEDIYNPFYLRLKVGWLKQEIWRRAELGIADNAELICERDEWQARLAATGEDWDW